MVHGNISLSSVIIDGETHRAKLFAKEASDRMQDIFAKKSHPNSALAHDKFLFRYLIFRVMKTVASLQHCPQHRWHTRKVT